MTTQTEPTFRSLEQRMLRELERQLDAIPSARGVESTSGYSLGPITSEAVQSQLLGLAADTFKKLSEAKKARIECVSED